MPNRTIFSAVSGQTLLKIQYADDPSARIIEPHAYGINTDGAELLRAYQTSGPSESGNSTGWKLFRVDRIQNVGTLKARFSPRPDFQQDDPAMTQEIFVEV